MEEKLLVWDLHPLGRLRILGMIGGFQNDQEDPVTKAEAAAWRDGECMDGVKGTKVLGQAPQPNSRAWQRRPFRAEVPPPSTLPYKSVILGSGIYKIDTNNSVTQPLTALLIQRPQPLFDHLLLAPAPDFTPLLQSPSTKTFDKPQIKNHVFFTRPRDRGTQEDGADHI